MSQGDDRRIPELGLQRSEGTLPRNRHERRAARRQERLAGKLERSGPRNVARVTSTVALVAAAATGHWWILLVLAAIWGVAESLGAVLAYSGAALLFPGSDPTRAHIGMGSTIENGAVVEPGGRVEMGATVQSGAIVKTGAIVGMGSTVQRGAVIEEDAIVGWGATVGENAIVRRGAAIGAGSTVNAGAVVPENARIGAGSTVASGTLTDASPRRTLTAIHDDHVNRVRSRLPAGSDKGEGQAPPEVQADPRETRINDLCDRLETELGGVSASVGEFLRNARETVVTVRRTCHDLLRRERDLRMLANPADLERLNREAASLQERIAAETDDVTRRQLQGAVAAIEEHRGQRALLLRDANRLDAEHTRLAWTMEGLLAQVVRLRTTEATSLSAATSELDQGLARLRNEVSSVSSAIEHVTTLDPMDAPFEPAPAAESSHAQRTPVRS